MKRLLLSGIAIAGAGISTLLLQTDVAFASPREPAAVTGWNGFYLGANVGVGLARNPTDAIRATPEGVNASPIGVIGGGQIGVNWHAAPNWVLGLEADIQGADQTDATTCLSGCGTNRLTIKQRLEWFGTVRGRLGWTSGPALFYGTGGFAYGKVTTDVDNTGPFTDTLPGSASHLRSGWTAGAGVEAALGGNWSGRIEYLYLDLGTSSGLAPGSPPPGDPVHFSSRIQDHVFRLGVNYKFSDPRNAYASAAGAILKAPQPVAASWNGFYVGGNVGLGLARNATSNPVIRANGTTFENEQFNLAPIGVLGGGQIGFNWQMAPNWVVGLEADVQASGQRDSTTCVNGCSTDFRSAFTQKLDWFGTVRGRLGWTSGPALFYATGGWAVGRVSTDFAWVNTSPPPNDTASGQFRATRSGWAAGAGIEARLIGNWTGKLEYLYVDLGTVSGMSVIAGPTLAGGTVGFSSNVRDHLMRVGVNYQFNAPAPLVTGY